MHNNLYTLLIIISLLSMVKDNKSCGKGKGKTGKARLNVSELGVRGRGFRVVRIASPRR